MPNQSLKLKATQGVFWTTIERLSVQLVQFVIGIVLARILSPTDYGLIGILAIFFAISQTFVNSGMGTALVQKNNRTEKDYSTVFVFNLVMSVVVYTILFFSAPFIAVFFEVEQLVILTRVLSLNIIINSLALVQRTRLTIKLDFKSIARVNFLSTLISGVIAIYTAYIGWGVWALVVQMILKSILAAALLWIISKWKVSLHFYKKSFKELFGFGFKLLIAGLYAQLLNNIYNIAIGKRFPVAELGFYTRSKQFAELTAGTISGILQQVTFPILASVNDDKGKMLSIFKKVIQLTSFIVFPTMTMLALLANPIVFLLLGEKWMAVVPLLQWMAFARIFYPISVINMSILNAMGRSDLFLKLDLAKFPLIAIALYISIPLGVKAMVIAQVIIAFIAFFMNTYLPGKYFGYGAWGQLKDMFPIMIATGIMALAVYLSINSINSPFIKIIVGSLIAIVTYIVVLLYSKNEGFKLARNELQPIIIKIYHKIIRKSK